MKSTPIEQFLFFTWSDHKCPDKTILLYAMKKIGGRPEVENGTCQIRLSVGLTRAGDNYFFSKVPPCVGTHAINSQEWMGHFKMIYSYASRNISEMWTGEGNCEWTNCRDGRKCRQIAVLQKGGWGRERNCHLLYDFCITCWLDSSAVFPSICRNPFDEISLLGWVEGGSLYLKSSQTLIIRKTGCINEFSSWMTRAIKQR